MAEQTTPEDKREVALREMVQATRDLGLYEDKTAGLSPAAAMPPPYGGQQSASPQASPARGSDPASSVDQSRHQVTDALAGAFTETKEPTPLLRWFSRTGRLQQRWWVVRQGEGYCSGHEEWRDVPVAMDAAEDGIVRVGSPKDEPNLPGAHVHVR